MKKLVSLPDVIRVVKTIIEDDYHLHEIDKDDHYTIEKITDSIFTAVRKRELDED